MNTPKRSRFLLLVRLIGCLFFFSSALIFTPPSSHAATPPPSTSPTFVQQGIRGFSLFKEAPINPDNIITFSEYPVGTPITNQYSSKGILFGGDSPFITTDGANPTSPVLSGTPRFEGAIEGTFVDPSDGKTPIVVAGFSLDAGYFDDLGTVRLTWYSREGTLIGQKITTTIGIESFSVEGGAIARWRIEAIKDEPSGFAVDNVSIKSSPALLFREDSWQGGYWGGRFFNYIPGFDHAALFVDELVYESNVLYPAGIYVDKKGTEEVINDNSAPACDNGVQYFHTKGTFKWDALKGFASTVTQNAEVPIPESLAYSMRDWILTKRNAPFRYLGEFSEYRYNLLPELQKGAQGDFTCVGLLEWAAEQSGYNNGSGFIRNDWESTEISVVDRFDFAWPPVSLKKLRVPLLSPELLYQITSGNIAAAQAAANDVKDWIQGFFDPIDFIITDPLGRRLGHTAVTGTLREIPGAFYSGDGLFEQFLITPATPGLYEIELVGVGEAATFGLASEKYGVGMDGVFIPKGEARVMYFRKEVVPGGVGDVDGDGDVDADDVDRLESVIPAFAATITDPGDMNRDGVLDESDVALLLQLTEVVSEPYPQPVGGKICSVLGNDPKPSLLDQDIFEFQGRRGDDITISLDKDTFGVRSGDRAALILKQKGGFSWLGWKLSDLPNQVHVTLKKSGTYQVIIGEQPNIRRSKPFRGNYCVTLDAPHDAVETFKPTAWVE